MMITRLLRISSLFLLMTLLATAACKKKEEQRPAGTATATPAQVVAPVEKTAIVTGIIEVPEGAEAHSVMVFAEGTSHVALTDRKGFFELSGLGVGDYVFRAMREDLEPMKLKDLLIADVDVEKTQPFADLGTFAMLPRTTGFGGAGSALGSVRGRVLTANPLDVVGVVVSIDGTEVRTVTDSNGAYALLNIATGPQTLTYTQSGYASQSATVEVAPRQTVEAPRVLLSFADSVGANGRTILGTLTMLNAEGNPVQGFESARVSLEGTAFVTGVERDGRFQFSRVPEGAYVVTATAPDFIIDRRVPVDLTLIDTAEVKLTLLYDSVSSPQAGTIVGRALLQDAESGGNGGISVSLTGTSNFAVTDEDGNYRLENVKAGRYNLVASMSQFKNAFAEGIEVSANQIARVAEITLERAVEAPKVLSTFPQNGATDVTIEEETVAVLMFSKKMNAGSLISAVSVSPKVEYRIATDGEHPLAAEDRLVLIFSGYTRDGQPLRYGTKYTIEVAETATSLEDVPMEKPFEMSFTTGTAKIVRSTPNDNSGPAFVNNRNPIRVYFNANINPEGFRAEDIRIKPDVGEQPNFTFSDNLKTGWSVLSLSAPFKHGEEYTVTIRGPIRTLTGDAVSNVPYTFRFKMTQRWEGSNRYPSSDRRDRVDEENKRK